MPKPINAILQAQFYLTEVGRSQFYTAPGQATRVKMQAAQGEPFGPATPQGNLDMLVVNEAAQELLHSLKIGKKFNLYFEPIEE
jgi:hypothetical protein